MIKSISRTSYPEIQIENPNTQHTTNSAKIAPTLPTDLHSSNRWVGADKPVIRFTEAINSTISKLYHRLITGDPLAFFKTADRIPALSFEEREEILKSNMHDLRNHKIFQMWEESHSLSEQEEIKFLAQSLSGTCMGQTVCLLDLMEKYPRASSADLAEKLKQSYDNIIKIQLIALMYPLFPHSSISSLPLYLKFAFTPSANRLTIRENGFDDAIKSIRFAYQKKSQQNEQQNTFCIPIVIQNYLEGVEPSHSIFLQITPICRLYDSNFPHMGFYDFPSVEEMLSQLPAYFNKYYKNYQKIQLP